MKIRCLQIPEVIADVLGGEASQPLREALDRHVEGCGSCATAHRDLASILERARATPLGEPPNDYWRDFLPTLRARIAHGDELKPSLLAWLRPILAGAALAGLALAAAPAEPSRTIAADLPIEALQRLASALDPIASDDEASPWEGYLEVPATYATGAPTGDLFAFYELASELTDEQAEALVRTLGDDTNGTKG